MIMIRQVKKIIMWITLVVIVVSSMNLTVLAEEMTVEDEEGIENLEAQIDYYHANSDSGIATIATVFGDTSITVGRSSEGMKIFIVTSTDQTATKIGVKDIKVKHKVWWGWETVKTSSGGYLENTSGMSCTIVYENAVQGDSYKIYCVHFAEIDGYHEVVSETTDFIYNF